MRLQAISASTIITLAALAAVMRGSVVGDEKPAGKVLPTSATGAPILSKTFSPCWRDVRTAMG